MVRPAFASVFALALTGCVFLVDSLPDDTSTTCHLTTPEFSSGIGACGKCITDNCQKLIDACCADSTCQAQLSNVDNCANEDGCSALANAGGLPGATTDLISCIESECPGECSGIDAGPADGSAGALCSSCETHCTVNGDSTDCSCVTASGSAAGNRVTCSSSSVGGLCCASPSFPDVSGSCSCETVTCVQSSGFCTCARGSGTTGDTTVQTCTPQDGTGSCCLSADASRCSCDPNDPCDQTDETPVDQCSAASLGCSVNTVNTERVTSCSVF